MCLIQLVRTKLANEWFLTWCSLPLLNCKLLEGKDHVPFAYISGPCDWHSIFSKEMNVQAPCSLCSISLPCFSLCCWLWSPMGKGTPFFWPRPLLPLRICSLCSPLMQSSGQGTSLYLGNQRFRGWSGFSFMPGSQSACGFHTLFPSLNLSLLPLSQCLLDLGHSSEASAGASERSTKEKLGKRSQRAHVIWETMGLNI